MEDWDCHQFNEFQSIERFYVVIGVTAKSSQICAFTVLIIALVYMRLKGTGSIGKLPILIAILALLNGIMAIIRINSLFPVMGAHDERLTVFEITYCCEIITFFGTMWFFTIKYYETATDLEFVLRKRTYVSSSNAQLRKR